jgi:hypothetical protein
MPVALALLRRLLKTGVAGKEPTYRRSGHDTYSA